MDSSFDVLFDRILATMTIDKSLRIRLGLVRSRNVLTRVERITKLKETDRWQEGDSPFNLPKVRVQSLVIKKKKKKEAPTAEGEEGAPTEESESAES